MKEKTTFFTNKFDDQNIMTGEETYNLIGFSMDYTIANELIKKFKGLNLHWNCEDKSRITWDFLKRGTLVIGSLKIWNAERDASYGFEYHPPLEFHAWIEERVNGKKIIYDLALPGVILKGLEIKDEYGIILDGRQPVILTGEAPDWLEYTGREYYLERG